MIFASVFVTQCAFVCACEFVCLGVFVCACFYVFVCVFMCICISVFVAVSMWASREPSTPLITIKLIPTTGQIHNFLTARIMDKGGVQKIKMEI